MRKSHSYSKRELLDSCLRQFFYEDYAAAKRLPFDPARKPLVQEMKGFTGVYLLARMVTADPCLLIVRQGKDVRRAARAFFALSQLNYSSPSKAQRYAHPIRETDSRLQQRMAEDMRGVK